jgi:hypothetical protein
MNRLKGVNTSVSEQVFSWFRGYAVTLNNMTPSRHCFAILYYCRRHNVMVDKKDLSHCNPFASKKPSYVKPKPKPYSCTKKVSKPAMKQVKTKKVIKKILRQKASK